MNKREAVALVQQELARFREKSYAELISYIPDGQFHFERTGPSGVEYQVEVQFFWDDGPGGNVHVIASIDDGGWRAFVPLNRNFIKAPDDSFIGE